MSSSEERLKRLQDRTLSGTTVRYVRYGTEIACGRVWMWKWENCFVMDCWEVIGGRVWEEGDEIELWNETIGGHECGGEEKERK
jgi:hypothetical protein